MPKLISDTSRRQIMNFLLWAIAGYLFVMLFMYAFQRQFIYHPDTRRPDKSATTVADMQVFSVKTTDGLDLEGWYKPPASHERPVVVMFHGNAGTQAIRDYKARPLLDEGYGFLFGAYRGFAGNPGKPSEQGLYNDARAYLDALKIRHGITADKIVLYGESLGTGAVTKMAAERRGFAGVILEAPYTSFIDLVRTRYFYLPVSLLLKDRFDNLAQIKEINAPLLIMHGRYDFVVPFAQGQRLFEAAQQPKEFAVFENGSHNDLHSHGAGQRISVFLKSLRL